MNSQYQQVWVLERPPQGASGSCIAGLAMTDYKIAVDILKSRFRQVDFIVSAHMNALVELATASSSHDIRKVRFIYDLVGKNVPQLQNLRISSSTLSYYIGISHFKEHTP